MQAIILAGGKGTRLADRLAGKPKPLIDVCGVPLLDRQIRTLERQGVDDVIVLVNHAADRIRGFLEQSRFAATIRIVDDGEPRGTAGAVLNCLDILAPQTLVVYGDTLFDIDISHMLGVHERTGADGTLLLHPNDHPADSDLVALDADGFVRAFHPYPHPAESDLRNLVNAALYVIDRAALPRWRGRAIPCDFAKDLFPAMTAAGHRLFGYVSSEYIKDLGTPARLDKVERHLASGLVERASRRNAQQAVLIDRDGTLNTLAGYVTTPAGIDLIPGAGAAIRRLNDSGLRTILVTNQPVLARGDCSFETLDRIHGRLETLLSKDGGYLDRILFCPHHPDRGFAGEVVELKTICDCRKPATGMIEQAVADLNIDRHRSWMVGDSSADMLAASRAELMSILVLTGEGGRDAKYAGTPDIVVKDIVAATEFILVDYPPLARLAQALLPQVTAGDLVLVDEITPGLAAVMRNELLAANIPAVLAPSGWHPADTDDRYVERVRQTGSREADETRSAIRDPDLETVIVAPWSAACPLPETRRRPLTLGFSARLAS